MINNVEGILCQTCNNLKCTCTPGTITIAESSVEGIDPEFHYIVKEYGRSMFATLVNASQANASAAFLNVLVTRLQNDEGRQALSDLIGAFNQLNNAYIAEMKWSEERMVACRKEMTAVMETKILTPPSTLVGTNGQPLKH